MLDVVVTPNWLAYGVIIAWPLVAAFLYARCQVAQATIWTILGAQLLLPVGTGIKIPLVPLLDKTSLPNLCALVGCLIVRRQGPKSAGMTATIAVLILANGFAPLFSVFENQAPVMIGARVLPAASFFNAGSAVVSAFFSLIPFVIGYKIFNQNDGIKIALKAFVLGGLCYSLPALYELRFSPQLHAMFYGYHPSEYAQSLRDGGYRPMVFMGHGLVLAFFMAISAIAAATLWKLRVKIGPAPSALVTSYLSSILLLCKSLGSFLYCVLVVPIILAITQRAQILIAVALAVFALTYPLLRSQGLVPNSILVQAAGLVSDQRALSLQVRFENEDRLLAHASQRLFFGWGGFGRNRIYGEDYGDDTTRSDGRWILTMGNYGLVGFLAEFGLLAIGVFGASRAFRYARSFEDRVLLASLSLIVAINIIELLPNSALMPWTWLFAGALLGRVQLLKSIRKIRSAPRVAGDRILQGA